MTNHMNSSRPQAAQTPRLAPVPRESEADAKAPADTPHNERPVGESGLTFKVANHLQEVEDAWRLVYRRYLETELVHPNPVGIHTVPQALHHSSATVCGKIKDMTVSTLTVMEDGPMKLPLDSVYPEQLDELRSQGRRMVEVGLFADRRDTLDRRAPALIEALRFALYFSLYRDATDAVIGVHPHHAPFYRRLVAFEKAGPTTTYRSVRDKPVVLLRCRREVILAEKRKPGLEMVMAQQIPDSVFSGRYTFTPQGLSNSSIADYLRHCYPDTLEQILPPERETRASA